MLKCREFIITKKWVDALIASLMDLKPRIPDELITRETGSDKERLSGDEFKLVKK